MNDIFGRKADHLELAAKGDVGFRKSTLLECVELIHDALPELDFGDIDLNCNVVGKRLRAPIIIAAMTGGTERAKRINLDLAELAEELGFGFGLGSQRAMLEDEATAASFQVRAVAPTTLVLGNIGGVQASKLETGRVAELVDKVGADALCVHLNPAMELIQAEGDRDFRGILGAIASLVQGLPCPIVVKETGCGISVTVARRLRAIGVRHVDVSGAGGTSWVAVEAGRADESRRQIGSTFREWGIPTAASVAQCQDCGFESIVATGGITNGLDAARAIALGATAVGMARPVLVAYDRDGKAGARNCFLRVQTELCAAMLLCGSTDLAALRSTSRLVSEPLRHWLTSPA